MFTYLGLNKKLAENGKNAKYEIRASIPNLICKIEPYVQYLKENLTGNA